MVLVHRKINNSYSKNKQFFWDLWILTVLNFKCAAVEPRSLNRNGTRGKISMCQRRDADCICMSPGTACMSWNEAVPWLLSASPIFHKAPQAAPLLICKLSLSSSLRSFGNLLDLASLFISTSFLIARWPLVYPTGFYLIPLTFFHLFDTWGRFCRGSALSTSRFEFHCCKILLSGGGRSVWLA